LERTRLEQASLLSNLGEPLKRIIYVGQLRIMKRIVLLNVMVLFHWCDVTVAQQPTARAKASSVRVSKQKPTVHITFVRFGRREPRFNNESIEGVWLRVHNNTRWPLTFLGNDWFFDEVQEVRVFYGIERIPEPRDIIRISPLPVVQPPPPGSSTGNTSQANASIKPKQEEANDCEPPPDDWGMHLVSPITLPPGKSMVFSVPKEALCKNLRIYLKYNYSWERHDRYRPFDYEPEHRVYFEGSELPKLTSLK